MHIPMTALMSLNGCLCPKCLPSDKVIWGGLSGGQLVQWAPGKIGSSQVEARDRVLRLAGALALGDEASQ
jgi:hypothetical protein